MSYIALATSTGPWIEPTLVLLGILIFRFLLSQTKMMSINHAIGYSTVSGAIGGIVAVACAWTFPMVYFLDPALFNSWMHSPFYFASLLSVSVLAAGGLGFVVANNLEHYLLDDMNIEFPIGALVHKMIFAQDQARKTFELVAGALITTVLTLINNCSSFIFNKINIIPVLSYGLFRIPSICIRFDLFPIFLSIGFVTGHVIALPLLFGLVSKIFLIEPIQQFFFPSIMSQDFLNNFVSGIVIQGAILSLSEVPRIVVATFKHAKQNHLIKSINNVAFLKNSYTITNIIIGFLFLFTYLYHFNFSIVAQLYLIIFTLFCIYQVLLIAGKTGLAPFPRFATFVLIPGMIIFNFDIVQIMVVSAFVEISCGVAVDILFGRKMAKLSGMDRYKTMLFQLLGLVICALVIGIIFYFLIHRFGLGSPELFAQRAQARALLVQSKQFSYIITLLGAIFGFSLRFIKVNYLLVIGSLLMQAELSFSLILGGLLTYLTKNKEEYYPFWSGVFAASSLLMLIHAFMS
jgi:hypothetical protein